MVAQEVISIWGGVRVPFTRRHAAYPVSMLILHPRDTSSVVKKLRHRDTTGCFKLIDPNSFRVPMSTPLLRDKTLNFCTRVYCVPAEAFTSVCVLSPPDSWIFYFIVYLGPDATFPAKKEKEKTHS